MLAYGINALTNEGAGSFCQISMMMGRIMGLRLILSKM